MTIRKNFRLQIDSKCQKSNSNVVYAGSDARATDAAKRDKISNR